MKEPVVSIGLPVYNGEKYLRQALDSLLAQDYENFELIISDNASIDGTAAICWEYAAQDKRIRYLRQEENLGAAKNFAFVFEESKGDYFMWAAHDDLWHPEYISKCLAKLQAHPEAVLCCSEIVFINPDDSIRKSWNYSNLNTVGLEIPDRVHEIISRMGWFAIYGLLRPEALRKTLNFQQKYGDDVILLLELALIGEFAKVPEPLFYYRVPNVEKTAQEHLDGITADTVSPPPEKPYTYLARELLKVVLESDISISAKYKIRDIFVRTLTFENFDWQQRILSENFNLAAVRFEQKQAKAFMEQLFADNDTSIKNFPQEQKRALVFFPHNPYPSRTGAHKRCLSMLKVLNILGYQVTLFSSTLFTDTPWTTESIKQLEQDFGVTVIVYQGSQTDRAYISQLSRAGTIDLYTPPGLVASFRQTYLQLRPNLIVVNYAYWGRLVADGSFKDAVTLIDTIDLLTLNTKMWQSLAQNLASPPHHHDYVPADVLKEDYFKKLAFQASKEEFSIYDLYDGTIAISPVEADIITENTIRTTVSYLPMAFDVKEIENSYRNPPVFVGANNPFNIHGYLHFTKNILPKLKQIDPDFTLNVVGTVCQKIVPVDGVKLLGFVEDLVALYAESRYAICPLLGGTGQKIKVVEAMAHGLPVIVTRQVAASVPITHGENGFVAENASEFAQYMYQLGADPHLCKLMGQKARQTIATELSEQLMVEKLDVLIKQVQQQSKTLGRDKFNKEKPAAGGSKPLPSPKRIVVDGVIFQLQADHPRGISRIWQNLIPELVKQLPPDSLVLLKRKGFPTGIEGVAEYEIPAYQLGAESKLEADDAMLARVSQALGADVFISTYYSRCPNIKNIMMIYDMIPELMGFDLSQPEWVSKQRAIVNAEMFVAISQATANDLARLYNVPASRITVAYPGVTSDFEPKDRQKTSSLAEKYNINKPYFVLVGTRSLYKNSISFLKAFASLPERDQLAVFVFGGEQAVLPQEVEYAKNINIVSIPWLPDSELSTAYAGALALVYPSRYEGFGLPVLEAMASGCPVITTRRASLPEVGGAAALYVDPDSSDDIVRALRKVLNPQTRSQHTTMGLEQTKKFSWQKMGQIVASVILSDITPQSEERPLAAATPPKEQYIVSAIVSTYNAERFIRGCLEDLEAQTIADRLEIIVIDSGSQQHEQAIVKEFQQQYPNIVYIRTEERETIYAAWNRGVKVARGKYLTNANTDDRHRVDALELLTRTLETFPEFGLVYADSLITSIENESFENNSATHYYRWLGFNLGIGLSNFVIGSQPVWRREVHNTIGYFNPALEIAGDSEFFLRVARKYGATHLQETLGLFYQDKNTVSGVKNYAKTVREIRGILHHLRQIVALDEIYLTLKQYTHDPMAQPAALFDYGNLCALSPYPDFDRAVNLFMSAIEQGGIQPEIINNLGVVLFCANEKQKAKELLQSIPNLLSAQKNLQLIQKLEHTNEKTSPINFDMLQISHPVIHQARCVYSLILDNDGTLKRTKNLHPTFWDVYLDPKGLPVSTIKTPEHPLNNPDLLQANLRVDQKETVLGQEKSVQPDGDEKKIHILLGPWDKSLEWVGQVDGADIICFGQEAPLPYQFHQDTMTDLVNHLPDGWQPDVFVSWQPHLYAVPEGWQNLNVPTFAVIVDWQLLGLLDGNLDWLRAFDGIFLDRAGVDFLHQQGFENVWHFLPSSFDPERQFPDPDVEKVFDISFAGALTHPIHRVRSRWLYQVAEKLANRYKIAFFDWSLKPDEYAHILKQSKIIFNHTYRGELNIRCYEALGAGNLLFLEEGNRDATGYFEDGVHYVSYNETNFEEKIVYYLTHNDERRQIALAGWKQVQKHTNAGHLRGLVSHIKSLLNQPRQGDLSYWTPQWQGINHIINFYAPMTPLRAKAAHAAWDAWSPLDQDSVVWLETSRASVDFRLATFLPENNRAAEVQKVITRLKKAISLQPGWAWPRYGLGQLYYILGHKEQAKETFQQTINLVKNNPQQAAAQFGPYLPYNYDHFMVGWLETNIQRLQAQVEPASPWATLLESRCQEMLAKIHRKDEALALARQALERAIELRPDIGAYHFQLAEIAHKQGDYETALKVAKQAIKIDTLNFDAWVLTADVYLKSKNFSTCVTFCDQKLAALKAFPNHHHVGHVLKNLRTQAKDANATTTASSKVSQPSQAVHYYEFSRPEIQALVPSTAKTILDVGCATGQMAFELKQKLNAEVWGIEYVPEVAKVAEQRLDRVITGGVEDAFEQLPDSYFDAIIFADVLEHLVNPAAVITTLKAKLTKQGEIVASIPNIRHWSVVKELLEGRWDYQDAGLLDRTHLRFFTRKSVIDLFAQAGFSIDQLGYTYIKGYGIPDEVLQALTKTSLDLSTLQEESQHYQYLVRAKIAQPVTTFTSIIVLTHNQLEHTRLCLQSIKAHTLEPYELIIIDNGSTDGTPDYLHQYQAAHDNVRVIFNPDNHGFAAGNNQGLAIAQGEYIVLLNNDTVVTEGWLARMLKVFKQYPDVGLVGPMSNYVSGPQLVKDAPYSNLAELEQFAARWATEQDGQSSEFFRLVGFCIMIRREVIARIGGLDEQFGSGNFEDDDFCLRAATAGFKARIAQDVFIHHSGNQTFKGAGIDYNQSLLRNWALFKAKWGLSAAVSYGTDYRPYLQVLDPAKIYVPLPATVTVPTVNDRGVAKPPFNAKTNSGESNTMTHNNILGQMIQTAQTAGRWDQAIQLLQEAVKHAQPGPEASALWNSLGVCYFQTGQLSEAETAFEQGLNVDPQNLDLLHNLAELYLQQEAYDRATEYLNRALRVNPDDVNILLSLGHCALMLDTFDVALLAYRRVKRLAPETVGIDQIIKEIELSDQPDVSSTNGYQSTNTDVTSTQETANQVLAAGQTALEQGDLERAAKEFAWVVAQYPGLAAAQMALGSTFLALGQNEAAAASFRRLNELLPKLTAGHNQLGIALYRLGQLGEAEVAFQQANRLDPADLEPLLNLVDLYRSQQRYDEAAEAVKAALTLDSNHPDVLIAFGLLSLERGDKEGAEMAWQRLPHNTANHPGVLALGQALGYGQSATDSITRIIAQVEAAQLNGEWLEGIALLRSFLKQAQSLSLTDKAALLNRLGYCHFMADQLTEAETAFKQGLQFAPNHLDLLNNLADLYVQQEQFDQATMYLNQALNIAPTDIQLLLSLGQCAIQLEAYDVALLAFKRVQSLAPETEGISEVVEQLQSIEADIVVV